MRTHRMPLVLTAVVIAGAAVLSGPAAFAQPAASTQSAAAHLQSAQSAARSWAWKHYGSFTVKTVHGNGDDVVALPKGLKAAQVTASTNGESNFAIWTLDAKNRDQDLLVNTIGAYSGTTAFGLDRTTTARKLEITADGDWSVTIRPIFQAAMLPGSHSGDGVYLYDHSAGSMRFTNAGDSNFAVWQYFTGLFSPNLLVNQIGHYSGTVPFAGGPSVFTISSNGHWTATRR